MKKLVDQNYSVHAATIPPHVAAESVLIPAFRELGPPRSESPDLASGEGLVAELGKWRAPRNPNSDEYLLCKRRWVRLQQFIRDVLEDPRAELEVAEGVDLHVQLAQAGTMLHINDLGDGIKQVLMIAAACIYYDDHLILLEEPEIHLHAGLQRKLIRFLETQTKNQYIVATHSAHVLDLPGAKIFHVTHDGTSTSVASAVRASEVHRVCTDLGYMASDLLQANYTLWVEGPSDRIYWRTWLKLVDGELEEGVHYALMTYGGYLVDGLHLEDEDVEKDLISLLRLGRKCTLIADSDKGHARDRLSGTLIRLRGEAARPGSGDLLVCTWVRTIENLVPRELFRQAVIDVHPVAGERLRVAARHGPYDRPFLGMGNSTYSKVRIAREVCERLTLDDMDPRLRSAARSLATSIRMANGMEPAIAD